jgi:hypothetical protein
VVKAFPAEARLFNTAGCVHAMSVDHGLGKEKSVDGRAVLSIAPSFWR